jgi:hypothetical protein
MRVSRNSTLIKSRARWGSYATLAGLAVLIAGFIASFSMQQYASLSLIALIIGFGLSQYGSYCLRRWGRSPRPDQLIEEGMKGFDDRYHFYAWSLAVPYVLLSPQGVFAFTTRDQGGQITNTGAQWKSKFSLGRALLMFAQEGLGNPSREANENAQKLEKWLKQQLPDASVTVQPVIIFLDPKVELTLDQPSIPVLESRSLKKWLRGGGKSESVKPADYRALENLFDSQAPKK